MKEIKNIIFDFGGVLVDLDKQRVLEAFGRIGFDATPYIGAYRQEGFFEANERGDTTEQEFLDSIPCPATDEEKRQAWCDFLVDVPRRRREAILRLRSKYRTFLLSNTNATHWQYSLRKWWRTDGRTEADYFEQMFLSYELHQCKPETDIFRTAIESTGVDPEETLYIDDSQANCDAAASCGLQTLCAKGDEWLGCVATVGHFDGVHLGHRFLIDRVREEAERRSLWSLLITFDAHPRQVVNPDAVPPALTTLTAKLQQLHTTGVDQVEVLHFDRTMASLSARDFLHYIKEELGVRVLLVGHDHHFGHGRGEGIEDYRRYGREVGVEVVEGEKYEGVKGEMIPSNLKPQTSNLNVSSSAIRSLLEKGDVEGAAHLLGRAYELTGRVVGGHQVGRTIGFPTANLSEIEVLLPRRGVYAATALGRPAVVNIGSRPTVDDGALTVEVHIPGFSGDLYGTQLTVQLHRRLRDERHFCSLQELKEQIEKDIAAIL